MSKNKNSKNGFVKVVSSVIILAFVIFIVMTNIPKSQKKETGSVKHETITFQKDGELTFQSSDGKYISQIDIEIADDDEKRMRGLMDRLEMKENQGMLFLFPYETIQSFWMHNTVIPLDMIFVNRNNEIVTIAKNTVPFDDGQYKSTKPASIVVEVNAGYTDNHNIKIGDKIVWRRN
jgi:uncharacterized membrane protein (UPF0127 family)